MCGIVGELAFARKPVDQTTVERMRDTLVHRGPDDFGIYGGPGIGLGFRRLAILDLSPAGHQPMTGRSGRTQIVFNGEIYNYRELREDLAQRGWQFKSTSDTEVILALYDEFGIDLLHKLRGMFGLAIWDEDKQRLLVARDRLGKKPLKYYLDDKGIVFASELKALLVHPRVPRQPDPIAIHHYLTLQYVPCPLTGFQGIKKLPPAHFLLVENDQVSLHKYWELNYHQVDTQRSENDWIEAIRNELDTSVKLRMISDVPLGAFLSGGIDSSAVVGVMAKFATEPVKTFSIGFAEESHNELGYAKQIAELFHTEHTEFIVEPQTVEVLPQLAWQYEEPFADSSALATYLLAKLTREHVTVALNGDGGDENFGGYDRYPIFRLASHLGKFPLLLRQAVVLGTKATRSAYANTLTDRMARFAQTTVAEPARRYLEFMQFFSDEIKAEMYTDGFAEQTQQSGKTWEWLAAIMRGTGIQDPVQLAMAADIRTYLPDDLLVKVDIATMAVSLEGRSPLLDHRFMELTAQIPPHFKVKGKEKKYIFRQALRGLLPDEILDRKKMGFGVPIKHWFRRELNGYIREHLLGSGFISRGILKPAYIENLIEQHTSGKISYAYQLWALLMLELWYEQYFDRH